MIRANDRPLEKRPNAFYDVGMNITPHPFFFAVIDRLVACVGIFNATIGRPIIGVNGLRLRQGVFPYELVKCLAVDLPPKNSNTLASSLPLW